MTGLGKLIRTTAFKLMAAYLLVFTLFAASLLGYFFWNAQRLLGSQINTSINSEINSLSDEYEQGGIVRLASTIEARTRRPGSLLYLVTTPDSEALAGNVTELPDGVLDKPGWSNIPYTRDDGNATTRRTALVRVFDLQGGYKLLVGIDLEDQSRVRAIMFNAALWSAGLIVLLGVAGGWFVARRVLHRLDDINATSRSIMAGDLTRRLKVSGTDDEIDRLASTTNTMLDRIQELMVGLKEVSDNIAHDLKTPLTRLRNHAEEALRTAGDEDAYRAALDRTIEESDKLIGTFNALLMIARAEGGRIEGTMNEFDVAEAAYAVAELYEPLAEEHGAKIIVDAAPPLPLRGNRELISQALANLIDNALKHGPREEGAAAGDVTIVARKGEGRMIISVADRGEGIAPTDRQRVLERFVRLESSRTRPGSGLGLALVSAMVKLHGGTIRLEDNEPGLRVVLDLPDGLEKVAEVQPKLALRRPALRLNG
ncbi:two-component sensor histidine kinase [Labrys miyagiensis]|uniref:histidine kinase n=1 Tax=Labrys miyagiensis TaxID=346912 RepID=A0ABQ6CRC0_9HYPH|nr:ATP-binding protein [Labrys miyagiensis]GLS22873.1 two-component sensor histidine kinase [Labrys miyagiensis]